MALYDVSTSEKKASPELVAGGTLYSSMPLASLVFFSGDTDKIPTGFCIADGRALSRTTYASLFAILGTTWGSGDGSTTFNIPDLSGKTAMGVETGHALGASEDGALPNITGNIEIGGKTGTTYGIVINNGHGALKSSTSSTAALPTTNTTTGNSKLEVDASLSNSIYTDGQTKVDPANVRAYWIIKISEVAVPADFLAKVDEAVSEAIIVKKGTWTGSIQLQKMGDSQIRDRFNIPITFDTPMPDDNYTVVIDDFDTRYITIMSKNRTATGFNLNGANTDNNASSTLTTVHWTAIRFPS